MTKVNINGANHQVEVQHDGGDLSYVVEKAQKLWDETKPTDKGEGPGFGYSSQVNVRANGWASFRHKDQPVVEP